MHVKARIVSQQSGTRMISHVECVSIHNSIKPNVTTFSLAGNQNIQTETILYA